MLWALRAAVKTPNCAIGSHTHAPHPRLDSARARVLCRVHMTHLHHCAAQVHKTMVYPPHTSETRNTDFAPKILAAGVGSATPDFFEGTLGEGN